MFGSYEDVGLVTGGRFEHHEIAGRSDAWDHKLSGASHDVAGAGVAPAQHVLPSVAVLSRSAPLPVGELETGTSIPILFCAEKMGPHEAILRYRAAVGALEDYLHVAWCRVLATTMDDNAAGDGLDPDGADDRGALSRTAAEALRGAG